MAFITKQQLLQSDQDTNDDIYSESNGQITLVTPTGVPSSLDFISEDGGRVIFTSFSRIVAADTDDSLDVYEWSAGGGTRVLSQGVAAPASPVAFNAASRDGSVVVFTQSDQGFARALYRHEGSDTLLLTPGSAPTGLNPLVQFGAMSTDGRTIGFMSNRRIVAGDTDDFRDAYVWDDGTFHRLSEGTNPTPVGLNANPCCVYAVVTTMSPSGNYVVFTTDKLLNTGDPPATDNQYLWHDGAAQRAISGLPTYPGTVGPGGSAISQVNDDGTFGLTSPKRFTADDASSYADAFLVKDGQATLASIGPLARSNTVVASLRSMSADGTRVYFETLDALVPDDLDASNDVYLREGGLTTLVSGGTGGPATARTSTSFRGETPDGGRVFFETNASLDSADTDGERDVYELHAGVISLVSRGDSGAAPVTLVGFSPDGVDAYLGTTAALVPDDADGGYDVYVASLPTAPVIRTRPAVHGGTEDGDTLTCDRGTWGGSFPQTAAFAWLRDGDPVGQGATYTLESPDVGHQVVCKVSATNGVGTTDVLSQSLVPTARAPQNVQLPSLPSSPSVGDELTCQPGTWIGTAPIDFSYAWLRDAVATSVTSPTYTVAEADATHGLACRVTATNAGGSTFATSPSRTVNAVPPQNTVVPAIPDTAEVGDQLSCDPGAWSGTAPLTFDYEWSRDGLAIGGASSAAYTVVDADALHQLVCRVTASNGGGSASAASSAVAIPAVAPTNSGIPSLPAIAQTGDVLNCAPGIWAGTQPMAFSFGWLRDGAVISSATSQLYTVAEPEVGHALACRVTASNVAGSATAMSRSVTPSARDAGSPDPGSPTTPAPPAGPVPFDGVTLRVASKSRRPLTRGIAITVACPLACAGRVEVRFGAATAKRVPKALRKVLLAQRAFALTRAGSVALDLRLSAAVAKTLRRLPAVSLTITAKSAAPTATSRTAGARLFGCRQPGPRCSQAAAKL